MSKREAERCDDAKRVGLERKLKDEQIICDIALFIFDWDIYEVFIAP